MASHKHMPYTGRVASHYAKISDVVGDRHKHRAITPRPPAALREKAEAAVKDAGTSMNAVVIDFLRWYVGETDELPQRPPRRDS